VQSEAAHAGVGASRRILLTSGAAAHARDRFKELERRRFIVAERFDVAETTDPAAVAAALEGAWAVVAGSEPYDRSVLARLSDLRIIARTGVGHDAIDLDAATARGVLVFTTPGPLAEAVADHTLALILACLRRVVLLDRAVRTGDWRPDGLGRDLHGATVVIVGLGAIGRAVARRLLAFSCQLIAVDPAADAAFCLEHRIRITSLHEALALADVVTLHIPLTATTRGLLDRIALERLPRSAVVVNTSRGAVVDEAALVDVLSSGRIAGAALDVFAREPLPKDHPLVSLENVVLTGHMAWGSREAVRRMSDAVVAGILAAATGSIPAGCLNPQAAARWEE
jgi:phosphoglycerate dehydrogenase-like enzyme